ncbi:hypothetical protein K435DRAFT_814241 [Dendrothele bispora CBS 962.96]|uniref:Uncharacterized protein n=1 Tax=Dendrothele bispora (strain CBS 962.96) TaxID=1314807 RepID=A0A4S8KJC3_DENBC|nr:hypothetical protein K435DRAFT_814241 [Dendrothele bispora CBS 962.96]
MADRLPSVYDLRYGMDTPIQQLSRALRNRTTSKTEDEPLCLASLLGLDVEKLLNVKESIHMAAERMSTLYLLMRELPIGIIFANVDFQNALERNLSHAPFRWAPRSLLLLEEPMNIDLAVAAHRFSDTSQRILGFCEQDGLHIQHNGILFSDEIVLYQSCVLKAEGHTVNGYRLTWYSKPGPSSDCSAHYRRDVALIFQTDAARSSDVAVVLIENRRLLENGTNMQNDVEIFATIVAYGRVEVLQETMVETSERIVRGVLTSPDQKCYKLYLPAQGKT